MGRSKRPFHRIVVTDSRSPRDGRFIEILGHYDPLPVPAEIVVDKEKVIDWLKKGVTLSSSVESLLRQVGIMETWRLVKAGKSLDELGHIEDEYRQKMSMRSQAKIEAKAQKKADKKAAEEEEEAKAKAEKASAAEAEEAEEAGAVTEAEPEAEPKPKAKEKQTPPAEVSEEAEVEDKPEEMEKASGEEASEEASLEDSTGEASDEEEKKQ
jgi:small subunit ribosomal protein S16